MTSSAAPKVYRLSNLPYHVDDSVVAELLSRALGDVAFDGVRIFSLATSANPWEKPVTKVATVMLVSVPAIVEAQMNKSQWNLMVDKDVSYNLILDTHFLGMTPLNEVSPEHYEIE